MRMKKERAKSDEKLNQYSIQYFKYVNEWSNKKTYIEELDKIIELLSINNNDVILDVGCGTGTAIRQISTNNKCQIIGIERSENAKEYWEDLEIIVADANNMPIREEAITKVCLIHSIGHIYKPSNALNELNRILKKEGEIVITTPNKRHISIMRPFNRLGIIRYEPDPTVLEYFNKNELSKIVKESGFKIGKILEYGQLPKILNVVRFLKRLNEFRLRIIIKAIKPF